jgi:hypothetical protein
MKHFSICLFMLLLLVLGKHNGARLPHTGAPAPLAAQARPSRLLPRLLPGPPAAGPGPRVAALMAR